MGIKSKTTILIYCLFLINCAFCQDCIFNGKRCSDSGQCCGGCCIEGMCINTYTPCYEITSPCLEHYCPPMMNCHVFKPDDCPGCELQAICE